MKNDIGQKKTTGRPTLALLLFCCLLSGCATVADIAFAPLLIANGFKESYDRKQTEIQEGHPYGQWIPLTIDGQPHGKIRFSNRLIKVEHAEDLWTE